MAEMATYNIAKTTTARLTAAAVVRGLRLTRAATTDLASAAAIGVRGDCVALTAGAASGVIAVCPLQGPGSVPVVSDGTGAIAIGDTVYSAAAGKVSGTATNAVLIGKARTAAAATDGILFVVELENPL